MAKAKSGGGAKVRSGGVKAGPPRTQVVAPAGAAAIGRSVGNHTMQGTVAAPKQPLVTATRSQVPMGNAVAGNVGRGGPGAGRIVHGSGSQGHHGPAAGTPQPQGRDILSGFGPESGRKG